MIVATKELVSEDFARRWWLSWPPGSLRIVDWNIDRGLKLPAIIEFLGSMDADVIMLQEVDMNADRTHRVNIAQEIARRLRVNYVFGREFIELAQGTKTAPAYQGQATLSRWKISNARIIHFRQQSNFWEPRWFKPNLASFQERHGGRIALAVNIDILGGSIRCYNLHLESRGHDQLRIAQLDDVLRDATEYHSASPVIVAGDFNLDASKPEILNVLERAQFRSAVPTARVPTTPGRHLLEPGRHIDWAFVRGPAQASRGRVHYSIRASDHYPISFDLAI